jgi:ankyrin repeat protein
MNKSASPEERLRVVLTAAAENMFPAEEEIPLIEVSARASDGDTPLHVFAWRGDVESSAVLIDAGAPVDAQGDMGETPLHVALRKENEALVALLMKAGANVDLRSEFDETARELANKLGGTFADLINGD